MSLTNESNRSRLSSRSSSRFGNLSHNMFFTRETAHPRRLRFFPGLNGRPVQMVDDSDQLLDMNALNSVWKLPPESNRQSNLPMYAINWTNLSRMNKDTLNTLQYFTGLRNFSFRDQQTPKQLNGLAPVVDAWKQELASFAQHVFQPEQEKPSSKPATAARPATTGAAERDVDTARQQLYSRKTGRLIESRAGRRTAGQRTVRYPPLGHALSTDDLLSTANGAENEYVIMQMLGQILQTDDPQAIGNWLASASDREKALAIELIRSVVASRSEYFKHDAAPQVSAEQAALATAKPPSALPKSAAAGLQNRMDLQSAPEKTSLELFTIAEESARDPAPTKADILNVDQERAFLTGSCAKLYGYDGETTAAPPAPVPLPRKVSALPIKSRVNTPGSVSRSCAASHGCPHCGHSAVESWRPATSYVNENASADASLPLQSATAN